MPDAPGVHRPVLRGRGDAAREVAAYTLATGCVLALAVAACERQPAPPPPPAHGDGGRHRAQSGASGAAADRRPRAPHLRLLLGADEPANGLVPDRWPTPSFSSIAAVGFGLTAYGVGAERGWITRDQALDRTLATLRFFARAPQGPDAHGVDRLQGLLLPLPRHGQRACASATSSCRRSTRRCCSAACCSRSRTSTATTARGGDPRARRDASTRASTGPGRSRARR